jgi:hypothetical protein|tara:strand:+ start:32 stop:250 length:219 start_codon:yes stop_codon:yes gene_type:complete
MSEKKQNRQQILRIIDLYRPTTSLHIVSTAFKYKHMDTLNKLEIDYTLKQNDYYPIVVQHKYKEKFQLKTLK